MAKLKRIQIEEAIQELSTKKYSTSLRSMSFKNLQLETEVSLALTTGVNVIAGGNGAGKSTILRALRMCLADAPDLTDQLTHLAEQYDSVQVEWCNGRQNPRTMVPNFAFFRFSDVAGADDQPGTVKPSSVFYVDAAHETASMLTDLKIDQNFGDLLDGLDPYDLDPDGLSYVSYILNRDYSQVRVFEVTATSEDDEITPYFAVAAMGQEYSVPSMGRGEFAAIYLIWKLLSLPIGSVVLLEEPEVHLAAESQRKLAEVLAVISVSRDLVFVTSTHSPGFFETLPDGHVSLVTVLPFLSVANGLSTPALASRLGLKRQLKTVAVTEDLFSCLLIDALVDHLDATLADSFALFYSINGESGVRSALGDLVAFKPSRRGFVSRTVVGVLDGDQRAVHADGSWLFLPGAAAPEEALRTILMEWVQGTRTFGSFDDATVQSLRHSLLAAQGYELHEWLQVVSEAHGGAAGFVRKILPLLMSDDEFRNASLELLERLSSGTAARVTI